MAEILPCPKCKKGKGILVRAGIYDVYIRCSKCNFYIKSLSDKKTEEDLINIWNGISRKGEGKKCKT